MNKREGIFFCPMQPLEKAECFKQNGLLLCTALRRDNDTETGQLQSNRIIIIVIIIYNNTIFFFHAIIIDQQGEGRVLGTLLLFGTQSCRADDYHFTLMLLFIHLCKKNYLYIYIYAHFNFLRLKFLPYFSLINQTEVLFTDLHANIAF